MPARRWAILRLLSLAVIVSCAATGCAPVHPSALEYLKSLANSHQLDTKAVRACTQGITPKPELLAARDSTLRFVRTLMAENAELVRDSILSSNRQGFAAICVVKTTDSGKPVSAGEYHLTPPSDGSNGAGDGGGLVEW
jgi:hypothetical protein